MSPAGSGEPSAGEVVGAIGEAASQLGSFVSHMLDEQPATAVAAALAAGFVAGGGLTSRIGTRLTATTVRATLGNVATLVALDLLRRALENGEHSSGAQSTATE
jgi:uncharacterized membrane protein YfcA